MSPDAPGFDEATARFALSPERELAIDHDARIVPQAQVREPPVDVPSDRRAFSSTSASQAAEHADAVSRAEQTNSGA